MLSTTPSLPKPSWLLNLAGLLLALGASFVLLYVLRFGAPERSTFALLLGALIVTPVLLRWQLGWLTLFLVLPIVNWIRRVYALMLPGGGWVGNDPLILLPDGLVVLMGLGALLTLRMRKREDLGVDDRALRAPIALFFGLCMLQVFNPFMGSVEAGFNGFRQFALYFALFFLTPLVIRNKQQIYRWMLITIIIGAITGLYGFYQYSVEFPEYDLQWAKHFGAASQVIGEQMRAFSTFSFTSTFSHYMLIACCTGFIALKLKGLGPFTRMLTPFFLGSALAGLAFTFVRSSYMGLIVACVIGLVVGGRPAGRWKRMLAVFIVTAALLPALPQGHEDAGLSQEMSNSELVTNRMLTMASPGEVGSMGARFSAWNKVFNNSFVYPAGLGIGAGQAVRFNGNYWLSAMAYTESQHFSVLAELGWPGMLFFLWITTYGLVLTLRIYDRLEDPDLKQIARLCLMLQVGLLVAGLTGGAVLYTLPGSAYYWAALSLPLALPRLERRKEPT